MLRACVQPEQLAIEHVAQPGEGVPVGRMEGAERPEHAGAGQPTAHVHVLDHVLRVVEVDEPVAHDGGVRGHHQHDDREPDPRGEPVPLPTARGGSVDVLRRAHRILAPPGPTALIG